MTSATTLSPQQTIIMQHLVDGITVKEIAILMCVKKETVRKHINKIKIKLGARTHDHAIALSVARGEVTVALSVAEKKLTA
jgi:DNA-binding CsgD family transcriptional regulator